MEETIFTKIIRGDIPSYKIYEDQDVYAFLDIHPLARGHTLVVPKHPAAFVWDLDDAQYHALMSAVKRIAASHKARLESDYVGVKVVGVDVPHAHVHVIPFSAVDEYDGRVPYTPSDDDLRVAMEQLQITS